ncbi:MAG: HD domain-containing protein [Treponema sp.]|nr:HD domain-containing protein [Treponema sp.]
MNLSVFNLIVTNFAFLFSAICFVVIILQNSSLEQRMAMGYTFFSVLVCIGYCLIAGSRCKIEMLAYGTKFQFLGSLVVVFVIIIFARYSGFKLPFWAKILLCAITAFLSILILTFDRGGVYSSGAAGNWSSFMSHWFFKRYRPGFSFGIPYLYKEGAWGYLLYEFFNVLLFVLTTFIFIRTVPKKASVDKINQFCLYCLIAIPGITFFIERMINNFGAVNTFPVVPIGFFISDVLFVYLIVGRRLCDVNDLASNAFFDFMNTPAVVVDSRKNIINYNENARALFSGLSPASIGQPLEESIPIEIVCAILNIVARGKKQDFNEIRIESLESDLIEYSSKVFQVRGCRLIPGGKFKGFIIWFTDVTLVHSYANELQKEVFDKTQELRLSFLRLDNLRDSLVMGFSSLSEVHDESTKGHLQRTSIYTQIIAQELYDCGIFKEIIDQEFVDTIGKVAPLHDIGKSFIDSDIFNKPGKLDKDEAIEVKRHTVLGADFLESMLKVDRDSLYANMAIEIARYHHEWFDGSGYPGGLKGNEIPLSARIMAVADAFDALVTERPYKRAFSTEEAFDIIDDESGTHFDKVVTSAFFRCSERVEEVKLLLERDN